MNLVKKILNIPVVWNTFQYLVGANSFKSTMYPSVFLSLSGKLLDFGCSCGNTTPFFMDFDYWGIDVDKEAISEAGRKFASYPNIKFQYVDLTVGPFKKEFFDHILFAGTAHHVTPDDLNLITKNLLASLRPGGEMHIFEPIRQEKDYFITRLFIRFDQGKYIRTKEELENFFEQRGYHISEKKLFPSPSRLIKLPDFLYLKIVK